MAVIEARGLRKSYGRTTALDGVPFSLGEGRILGLLGPNGAGKSTALEAMLGLIDHEGDLTVLGRNPWAQRDQLMQDVCFIADVAVLPRWMKVSQALDYMTGVHPRFDRTRAENFLARTLVRPDAKVRELSKGMVTQLHLALVMAIDARLLVLDEPTLGLDLLYRKAFYDTLLNDYVDHSRTIIISTHDLYEVEHILTDVAVLDRGRLILNCTMDALQARYLEVVVTPTKLDQARALAPVGERRLFGRVILMFDGVDEAALAKLGDVRAPSLADVFLAVVGALPTAEQEGAA